jgi:hypothetical protein
MNGGDLHTRLFVERTEQSVQLDGANEPNEATPNQSCCPIGQSTAPTLAAVKPAHRTTERAHQSGRAQRLRSPSR